MTNHAKSSFVIEKRDSQPAPWTSGQMNHSRFTKRFSGPLEGTSEVEAIMLLTEVGPMVYVGIERFDCVLDGRAGTFLLLHGATSHAGEQTASWSIAPGSGTGELAGIRGDGEILPNHEFLLRYDLAP